ncbi:PE_PGRS family protein [Streptomyces himastatinicus ATCC 53653]|uniref:PE_PGRS family protein n=1 Tax=Streptomyces himastatinicus ATCC 53653 TaxID=457427 RepID=D9WJC2_9ACTN|nr:AAWKG family protein [Streptomyces himastatinicus]EFL29219.1 PE_PGRS family protein [Streptomyces himastatinicus ATCC 53653]
MADDKEYDDYWAKAVNLFTGYDVPSRRDLFNALVGNDGIKQMRVEITKQGSVQTVDADDFNWMVDNAGWDIQNTDFVIPFYTNDSGTVHYYKARFTLIGFKSADGPSSGEAVGGEIKSKYGQELEDGHFKPSDTGTVWNTWDLTSYAYGTGNALKALLEEPNGTLGFSWGGSAEIPLDEGVRLGSFDMAADAFDRVAKFFWDSNATMTEWQNKVGLDQNEAWKGMAAGVFWDLIHELGRRYGHYADDMEAIGGVSKQGKMLRQAGDDLEKQARKIYNKWDDWKLAGGNPLRPLVDLLGEIADQTWLRNLTKVNADWEYSGGYYGGGGYWDYSTAAGFSQDAYDGDLKSYGDMKELETWKRVSEQAIANWEAKIKTDLIDPAEQALKDLAAAWGSSHFDLGSIRTKGDKGLNESFQEDKAFKDKKDAEDKAAKDKKAADDKYAADKKAAEDKAAADKAAADAKYAADKKAADDKAAADKAAADKKYAEEKAAQEKKEKEQEAKQEQKEKEAEEKAAALQAKQDQKEKEAEEKAAQKEKEQEQKQAEQEAKQEQKEKEAEQKQAEQEAKQEQIRQEQEKKQEQQQKEAEQKQAEQEAKQEQIRQEQEAKQEQKEKEAEQKQAEQQAKQDEAQKQAQAFQVQQVNQQKAEQEKRDKEQAKQQAEQEAKQEQLQQEQEAKQEQKEKEAEQKQAEQEAKQEQKEKEAEQKQEEQQKKQEEQQKQAEAKQEQIRQEQEQKQEQQQKEAEQKQAEAEQKQEQIRQEQEQKQEEQQKEAEQKQAEAEQKQEQIRQEQEQKQEQQQKEAEQKQDEYQQKQEKAQEEQQKRQEELQQQQQQKQDEYQKQQLKLNGSLNNGDLGQHNNGDPTQLNSNDFNHLSPEISGPVNGDDSLTNPDGSQSHLDSQGRVVTEFPDGSKSVIDPHTQTSTITRPDGSHYSGPLNSDDSLTNPGGSTTRLDPQGQVVTEYPDGSTTRVDPDTGATSIISPDGTSTTGYLNNPDNALPDYQYNGPGGSSHPGGPLNNPTSYDYGNHSYEEELYDDKPYQEPSLRNPGQSADGGSPKAGGGTPLNSGPMPSSMGGSPGGMPMGGMPMGGMGGMGGGKGGEGGSSERVRNVIDNGDVVSNRRNAPIPRGKGGVYEDRQAVSTSGSNPFLPRWAAVAHPDRRRPRAATASARSGSRRRTTSGAPTREVRRP